MSYARKNLKNVIGAIVGILTLAAIAVWQFYLFATFSVNPNVLNAPSGSGHLWWAGTMTVFACSAAFLVFMVFVRHDTEDDLHITAMRRL
jgi:hypothetical protein